MSEESTYATEYARGFNEGYLIARHLPELSDGLAKIEHEQPRIEGFKDGSKEYALEKINEERPRWMERDLGKGKDTERPADKDKDR